MCWGRHIHGALGLTDERIHTILVAPPGDSYQRMKDVAKVTQMLKAPSIAIVTEEDAEISTMVDDVIRLPNMDETLFSVPAILPGQLLPYYCAVELGDINPDCQRSNIPKYARVWSWLFPPGTH
jgi:glucosamine 6-phosphate synthetase-like amidotransferase/phosphosugar isomerase protein